MTFRVVGAVSVVVALTSCRSAPPSPPTPSDVLLIIPAGEGKHRVFRDRVIEEWRGKTWIESHAIDPDIGAVACGAEGIESDWAALVYERGLAFTPLSGGRVAVVQNASSANAVCVAVKGEFVAVLDREELAVLRIPTGRQVWRRRLPADGRSWYYALPTSETRVIMVGAQDYYTPIAQLVDLSTGDMRILNNNTLKESLSRVHRCAGDGRYLYVAGVNEWSRPGRLNNDGNLFQNLVVLRIDPDTLEAHALVQEPRHERECEVTGLAVNRDRVAMVVKLYQGERQQIHELRVYSVGSEGAEAAAIYKQQFREQCSICWAGSRELAIAGEARDFQIVSVP